jgi:hypothetical protein
MEINNNLLLIKSLRTQTIILYFWKMSYLFHCPENESIQLNKTS